MQPSTLTVHEIFEKERRYTVPLFQRAYVWTLEDQWEPLWEDIERQARICLGALKKEKQVTTSHFLGAVVLNVAKVFGRGLARSEIIDGQQRLTTLQIFLAALRDFSASVGDDITNDANRLTLNPIGTKDSDERYKVWPTNADRDVFKSVISAGSLEKVKASHRTATNGGEGPMPKLAEAYAFFYGEIKKFVDGDEIAIIDDNEIDTFATASNSDRLYSILHTIKTSLQFVVIELEERDDPQVIFETLNARGQPLLPSDLIRNTIFLEASNKGKDIDALYTNFWRHFDDTREDIPDSQGEDRFWHISQRQGRLTRPRVDLLIFHDLTVRTEKELNIGRLFREFRDWYINERTTTEEYLASLKRNSDHYARLIAPTGYDRISIFARRLRSLDTSTVYPALLYLLEIPQERLSSEGRDQIIEDLESFLVRRFICQLTTKNYNHFFLNILRRLKRAAESGEDLTHVVRTELLRSGEPTSIWPTDNSFRNGWLNNPIYVKSRPDRSSMILQALNNAFHTNKSETVVLSDNLTVEHLLPQGWEAHYPFPNDLPLDGDDTQDQRRYRLIHTTGNLTLLTGPLNTAISNGPFKNKAKEIAILSDLRINAQFREKEFEYWDERDILKRGGELFEKAKIIWPQPNTN